MKKIYDKLFLVIALSVLLAGVFLYLEYKGQTPNSSMSIEVEVVGISYQNEEIPSASTQEASWPEPTSQSAGPEWIYDVFTPPEIYIDQDGNFVPTGWKPAPPPAPFGVYLSDIVREPYRIQLEGYIEEDRTDPSKSLLLFFDEDTQKQVRVRPGNESVDSEFKVISFNITRLRDEDGNIKIEANANILDNRTGQNVLLVHGQRLFLEDLKVLIRSDESSEFTKEITEVPSIFKGPSGEYTLQELNLDESTVLVKKHGTDTKPAEIRTLKVRSKTPAQTMSPIPTPKTSEQDKDNFDFIF
ncbi:MAG: hypothetical protein VXZ83_06335 [Verrucomicrobiota bacterium]|nr:hypothetical protein [Verrucomicrobiota bacterium]